MSESVLLLSASPRRGRPSSRLKSQLTQLAAHMADLQASLDRLNDKIERCEQGRMTGEKQLLRQNRTD